MFSEKSQFFKKVFLFLTKFVEQTSTLSKKLEFSDFFIFFWEKYNKKTIRFIFRKTLLLFAMENVENRGNIFCVNIKKMFLAIVWPRGWGGCPAPRVCDPSWPDHSAGGHASRRGRGLAWRTGKNAWDSLYTYSSYFNQQWKGALMKEAPRRRCYVVFK